MRTSSTLASGTVTWSRSLSSTPDFWSMLKSASAITKPPTLRYSRPVIEIVVSRVIWASVLLPMPSGSPLSSDSAAQSSRLPSAAAPLKRSARLRISMAKSLGRPYTPMAPMPAVMPIQLRVPVPPSLTMSRSRLALETPKPMASLVSRPVTLPSASSSKAPFTPTKNCRLDSVRRWPVALASVMRPSEPLMPNSWSKENSPAAST